MRASRRGARGIACGAWVFLALLSGSCSEKTTAPECAPERIAVLEGYVSVTGQPVEVEISARDNMNTRSSGATTRSNAAGWYRLELTPGTYRLRVDQQTSRDTVRVAAGRRRWDIRRGSLTIRIATPPELENRGFRCDLVPLNGISTGAGATARDGQLEYSFPSLETNIYRIRLAGSWLPGTYDAEAATRIPVPATHPIVYEADLHAYATISGSILGSWQQQQQTTSFHPHVAAYTPDMHGIVSETVESDGSYTLELFGGQPVKLVVDFLGIRQWIGGDSFETATLFTLQPGEHLRDVSLVEGGIQCRLEGPGFFNNHQARVSLRDSRGRTFETQGFSRTLIPICNLPPESYTVWVHGSCGYDAQDWASQWYDGADSLGAATAVQVVAGQLVPITVHLTTGASLEGRVLSSEGEPTSFYVRAVDQQGMSLCDGWLFDRQGIFRFGGLNNGKYRIAARRIGGSSWWYPGTPYADSARVIEIRDRMSVTGIEWRLPPRNVAEGTP